MVTVRPGSSPVKAGPIAVRTQFSMATPELLADQNLTQSEKLVLLALMFRDWQEDEYSRSHFTNEELGRAVNLKTRGAQDVLNSLVAKGRITVKPDPIWWKRKHTNHSRRIIERVLSVPNPEELTARPSVPSVQIDRTPERTLNPTPGRTLKSVDPTPGRTLSLSRQEDRQNPLDLPAGGEGFLASPFGSEDPAETVTEPEVPSAVQEPERPSVVDAAPQPKPSKPPIAVAPVEPPRWTFKEIGRRAGVASRAIERLQKDRHKLLRIDSGQLRIEHDPNAGVEVELTEQDHQEIREYEAEILTAVAPRPPVVFPTEATTASAMVAPTPPVSETSAASVIDHAAIAALKRELKNLRSGVDTDIAGLARKMPEWLRDGDRVRAEDEYLKMLLDPSDNSRSALSEAAEVLEKKSLKKQRIDSPGPYFRTVYFNYRDGIKPRAVAS